MDLHHLIYGAEDRMKFNEEASKLLDVIMNDNEAQDKICKLFYCQVEGDDGDEEIFKVYGDAVSNNEEVFVIKCFHDKWYINAKDETEALSKLTQVANNAH